MRNIIAKSMREDELDINIGEKKLWKLCMADLIHLFLIDETLTIHLFFASIFCCYCTSTKSKLPKGYGQACEIL